jgi:hypothetical protein
MRNKTKATAIDEWMARWTLCKNKEKYQMMELKEGVKERDIWERTKIQSSYMELTNKNFRCIAAFPVAGLWVHEKDTWENCLRIPYQAMVDGKLPKNPEEEELMPVVEKDWKELFEGWIQD